MIPLDWVFTTLNIENKRLKTVVTPQHSLQISYIQPPEYGVDGDSDITHQAPDISNNATARTDFQEWTNNVVQYITKTDNNTTPNELTKETYTYNNDNVNHPVRTHTIEDRTGTGITKTTSYEFSHVYFYSPYVPSAEYYSPRISDMIIDRMVEDFGEYKIRTYYQYEDLQTIFNLTEEPCVNLLTGKKVDIEYETFTKCKSFSTYDYSYDLGTPYYRDYINQPNVQNKFGYELTQKKEKIWNPEQIATGEVFTEPTNDPLFVNVNDYLNLPLATHAASISYNFRWAEYYTLREYAGEGGGVCDNCDDATAPDWHSHIITLDDMMNVPYVPLSTNKSGDAPQTQTLSYELFGLSLEEALCSIVKYFTEDQTTFYDPPIFNLMEKSVIYKNSIATINILNGIENTISTTAFDGTKLTYNRGKPTSHKLIGNGGVEYVEGTTEYSSGYQGGGLPRVVKNANGATTINYYLYNHNNYKNLNGNNPNYAVRDFWDQNMVDTENKPCSNSSYFMPAGKIITNDDEVFLDKINESFNLFFRSSPVAVRQMIRKYKYDGSTLKFYDNVDIGDVGVFSEPNTLLYEPNTNGNNAFSLSQIYEYDINNNVTATISPNGWMTTTKYDKYGRILQLNAPFDFDNPADATDCIEKVELKNGFSTTWEYSDNIHVKCCNESDGRYRKYYESPDYVSQEAGSGYIGMLYIEKTPGNTECPCADPDPGDPEGLDIFCDQVGTDNCYEFDSDIHHGHYVVYKTKLPAMISEIRSLTDAYVKIEIEDYVSPDNDIFIQVDIPAISFTSIYALSGTMAGAIPISTNFQVDLSNKLTALQTYLNTSNDLLEVEIKLLSDHDQILLSNGENTSPRLIIEGDFNFSDYNNRLAFTSCDYTVKNLYDGTNNLNGTLFGNFGSKNYSLLKIDDQDHTSNDNVDFSGYFRRDASNVYELGPGYLVTKEKRISDNTELNHIYNGLGGIVQSLDQANNAVTTTYDVAGRVIMLSDTKGALLYQKYEYLDPSTPGFYNPNGVSFYGLCFKKTTRKPRAGQRDLISTEYFDAFGKLVMEVQDDEDALNPNGVKKTTSYFYDETGKLIKIINPAGQEIKYWYNAFGEVIYKDHPDFGYTSYAYDKVGNLRFQQSQEQADQNQMSYYEFDDLNRVTVFGVADLDPELPSYLDIQEPNVTDPNNPIFKRFTDYISPDVLQDGNVSSILTANKTLWQDRAYDGYIDEPLEPGQMQIMDGCVPSIISKSNEMLGSSIVPNPDHIMLHKVSDYDDRTKFDPRPYNQFENIQWYPEFVRMAYQYDEMPDKHGTVWSWMPEKAKWDAMAPSRNFDEYGNETASPIHEVRNQKGKVAAIAYRTRGHHPFNYLVYSYDERGRVEAQLRYTQNIGFDALYYEYNSMDKITSVRVVDPSNEYITWYSYDSDGRVDKVWTTDPQGEGICGNQSSWTPNDPKYIEIAAVKPTQPDITYDYDIFDHIDKMTYPGIDVEVNYSYKPVKKFLMGIDAVDLNSSETIFSENIAYDPDGLGQIIGQTSKHLGQAPTNYTYQYDDLLQLTHWHTDGYANEHDFVYDPIGKRLQTITDQTNVPPGFTQDYSYGDPNGPNRLTGYQNVGNPLNMQKISNQYNANGELVFKQNKTFKGGLWHNRREEFHYSPRGLMDSYTYHEAVSMIDDDNCWEDYSSLDRNLITEWMYNYSPSGDREQKRLNYAPGGDNGGSVYPWVYYLMGNKQQYSVYNGAQISDDMIRCNNGSYLPNPFIGNSIVFMYAAEYNTFVGGVSPGITYKWDGSWVKEFKIKDHSGSIRSVLRQDGSAYTIEDQIDYKPFGQKLANSDPKNRNTFIGRERDYESKLNDFGVRKYSDDVSGFTRPDPLWEQYYNWSPYVYSGNNPMMVSDPSGLNWFINSEGTIKWFDRAGDHWGENTGYTTYDSESGEFTLGYYFWVDLGKNVIVCRHNRGNNLVEVYNTAIFEIYLESRHKAGKGALVATGNTVPSNINKRGVLADGLYEGVVQKGKAVAGKDRGYYTVKLKDENGVVGGKLQSLKYNSYWKDDVMDQILIHFNSGFSIKEIKSDGCQTINFSHKMAADGDELGPNDRITPNGDYDNFMGSMKNLNTVNYYLMPGKNGTTDHYNVPAVREERYDVFGNRL